jgi:hypothetical protein
MPLSALPHSGKAGYLVPVGSGKQAGPGAAAATGLRLPGLSYGLTPGPARPLRRGTSYVVIAATLLTLVL